VGWDRTEESKGASKVSVPSEKTTSQRSFSAPLLGSPCALCRRLPTMHSLNDNASDEEMPDDESSDGDQASPHSLSQIDTDDAVNHCDMCQKSLGGDTDTDARAFRCYNCELSVQCETCCSGAHLSAERHVLQVSALTLDL
jgi:hypothetical protein